jgi:hypothetical protein
LDHHPVGLAANRDLELFTRSSKVTGIKQRPTQTESSQFVFRVLLNQFALPSKYITHNEGLSQILARSSVVFYQSARLPRPHHKFQSSDGIDAEVAESLEVRQRDPADGASALEAFWAEV